MVKRRNLLPGGHTYYNVGWRSFFGSGVVVCETTAGVGRFCLLILSSPFSAAAAVLTSNSKGERKKGGQQRRRRFINPDDVDTIFPSNRKPAARYTKEIAKRIAVPGRPFKNGRLVCFLFRIFFFFKSFGSNT